jgi:hypothetical protein
MSFAPDWGRMVTERGGCDFLHLVAFKKATMLFSLIHTEIGSDSQHKLLTFGTGRRIQSLFGYHHLTLSLMETHSALRMRRGNLAGEIAHLHCVHAQVSPASRPAGSHLHLSNLLAKPPCLDDRVSLSYHGYMISPDQIRIPFRN